MEKKYTKKGYSYLSKDGKEIFVSREMVAKAITDQTKLKTNVDRNLKNLNDDLTAISAVA